MQGGIFFQGLVCQVLVLLNCLLALRRTDPVFLLTIILSPLWNAVLKRL